MLPQMMSRLLNGSRGVMKKSITRNFGVTAVALKELDPVQALFIEKIKEYTQASAAAGEYQWSTIGIGRGRVRGRVRGRR